MQGRLLIVDDDELIRDLLTRSLSDHGYICDAADSFDAAVSLLMENDYDIVITDKNMPVKGKGEKDSTEEGGIELIRMLKEFDPSVVVIIMTGFATIESTISAMKLGAFDFICKPLDLTALKMKVDRIREYQDFLNPESILDIYSVLHNEILDLIAKSGITDGNAQQEYLNNIDDKFDFVFNTFKSWERIIISQRDRLAKISTYAEQILDRESVPADLTGLVKHIADEATGRL